jgi:hypothetical protein
MTPRHAHRPLAAAITLLAACLAAATLASCNILGPAGYFILGPEKAPAMYELDPARSAVVFIDDRSSKVPDRSIRTLIGQTAERDLLERKVVQEVISSEGLASVVARERFGQPMGIAEIGEAVGAKTIIYATIDEFTLAADGNTFAPRTTIRVKVLDTESKQRLWPKEDPGWFEMIVQMPERQGLAPQSPAEVQEAQRLIASRTGAAIAKLFYKHESTEGSERIGR